MNIKLVLYVIYAILIGIYGTVHYFKNNRIFTAVLFLAGAIAVFTFFGIRWFGPAGTFTEKTVGTWPPLINTCPDYLTYYKRILSTGQVQDTCVDRLGVSKNSSLEIFPKNPAEVNTANDKYFFPLETASQDVNKRRAELCNRCKDYGLTWEGIFNGESCVNITDSTGGDASGSSSGSAACPSTQ
jgi:hypothetical protein